MPILDTIGPRPCCFGKTDKKCEIDEKRGMYIYASIAEKRGHRIPTFGIYRITETHNTLETYAK
jgi:hypothetical protein